MNLLLDDIFLKYDEIIKNINLYDSIDDDIVYKIFKKINKEINEPHCSSSDKNKPFKLIKELFNKKDNYIGANHLNALIFPNNGSYYYYYEHVKILKLFLEKGIMVNENHVNSYTNPNIIIFLYNEGIDLINIYINYLMKKNKIRFIKIIIKFLFEEKDLFTREDLIKQLMERNTLVNYIQKLTNK